MMEPDNTPMRQAACPICGKPAIEAYRPFCSKRCADVDLQRWFTGSYAIPTSDDEDPDPHPSGARMPDDPGER
jgi:endogenous inhibitor of DNA gyrase (YacG/DUF329 family)